MTAAPIEDAEIDRLVLRGEHDPPLLLGPGIRQGFGEAGDREIRRRCAIGDRCDDARRKEGERSEQADVPFAHGLPFGNPGEGGNAAEPDVVENRSCSPDSGPDLGILAIEAGSASNRRIAALGAFWSWVKSNSNAVRGRF